MQIRDALPADFPRILALNEESVQFLSPLTPERLELLHDEAAYHRVMEIDGVVVAFLLALPQGCTYDSPNYRWFASHFDSFIYIDRIVVSVAHQGCGIGRNFYDNLFLFAKQGNITLVACEFDIDPPNDVSRRFHRRLGFTEVGTQRVGLSGKRVSLQTLSIRSASST